jgi:hypothetical protein
MNKGTKVDNGNVTVDYQASMSSTATIGLTELKSIISRFEALRENGGKMNDRWIDPDGLELFVASSIRAHPNANFYFNV